ncbi:transcription cofactor vestigial-like protein 2 isoform X1 [Portunus trituberculatus]|uniref:transcription cofactor vestigial-like protein 2 isoform X1 n=1 Tax=Portunus trituberculatus TaxID=210409 RepID=UPI001E1CB90B|nr:transcription cofactor vestigial-like protein 2 isoform X1 [Portunus trituberculatus]XP_045111124.1 transcription cofactor vestigial-like protein 2 isoform X1 [Portunus trituberculatus]XP_045111125.1 transcription cofactor vestigial-like protein 2 isoform X1 [Portunus trituberculatus]
MAGVMYQGYASYLQAYQRHSNPYCPSNPLALNHYDKKYRLQDAGGGGAGSSQPPTPDLQTQQQQQQQQQFAAAVASTSTSTAPIPQTPVGAAVSGTAAAPPAPVPPTAAAVSAAAAVTHGGVCSSPVVSQQQQQQQTPQQQAVSHAIKTDEKGEPQHADAHYISANCVVLTYFSGDLATAVDEHFSRALTQSFSKTSKDPCPMSQRNLPASFWNSHYHAGVSGYGSAGSSVALAGHEGLYPDYSSLHGLHQGDPWAYNFTAAGQYPHHRSMADFTYMPSSSRYPHNYSSLLMGRAPRLPQCVVGKADPWTSAPRLHDEMTFDPAAAYTHHFSSMSGLEGAGASQEGSKDLYWF